ncbi:MAG: 8-oxo-dGTP diphosphatase [bacterium]|nr:8-oxo-dGTP diphosphatase [bacterium]
MSLKKKILTLCIIHTDTHVLLGMKKRGFGAGRWNGFGGKVQEGEDVETAAEREVREEAYIAPTNLKKRGILFFEFENNPGEVLEIHVFNASVFKGEPAESEEMKPQWFLKSEIPFSQMWPDDIYWLPLVLEGKSVEGKFYFRDNDTLLRHELAETEYSPV